MSKLDAVSVRDYMTTQLVTLSPQMEVMAAINQLVKNRISGAPVLDADGQLVGMLSEMDCMQVGLIAAEDTCVAGPVQQFMKTSVVAVSPDDSLTQLAQMFLSKPYRRFPVLEGGKLVGQISRSDVLRAINAMC
ncbi:CBS domain-containing protein [Panacagrimonas sp.]|uniref:CBS domain-containing protein n=1 Tax=Panacagrimonas sp. TaxID=2480088 RepID=UPI003B518AAC